jgi:hypothetical protein
MLSLARLLTRTNAHAEILIESEWRCGRECVSLHYWGGVLGECVNEWDHNTGLMNLFGNVLTTYNVLSVRGASGCCA